MRDAVAGVPSFTRWSRRRGQARRAWRLRRLAWLRSGRSNGALADQLLVVGISDDPEPHEPAWDASTPADFSPPGPRRGREAGLPRGQLIRPDHHLLAVLPLDGHCLVADLEPTLIDGKVAKEGPGPQLQQRLSELVGVQAPHPPRRLHKELATGVRIG